MHHVTPVQPLENRVGCIAGAMRVIGNKWTALILRDLASGPQRFGELEKSVYGISPRTLSQRLNDLECQGIISKRTYSEMPPRTEYALTAKGKDLIPVLKQMAEWGEKYHQGAELGDLVVCHCDQPECQCLSCDKNS